MTAADRIVGSDDVAADVAVLVAAVGPAPVVVTEQALLEVSERVSAALDCPTITITSGEPTVEVVTALSHDLARRRPGVAVAVGGGTVIDTAKLAARLADEPDGLVSRLGVASFPRGVDVVAVPTTAGAGAECTRTAVVSHAGRKCWAWDEALRPQLAILASELTVGLPARVTVASGLDAFVHALEAGTGRRRDARSMSIGPRLAGSIAEDLPRVLSDPRDLTARARLLESSASAGSLIDRAGTTIGHGIGHAIASLSPMPHGLAVLLGHRAALEWNLSSSSDRYAPYSAALSSPTVGDGVDRLCDEIGFDEWLRPFDPPDVGRLAVELAAPEHRPMFSNNPRSVFPHDFETLARLTTEAWPT